SWSSCRSPAGRAGSRGRPLDPARLAGRPQAHVRPGPAARHDPGTMAAAIGVRQHPAGDGLPPGPGRDLRMMRTDPLTGALVVVNPARQDRPQSSGSRNCPFCPGGLEAPDKYDVRWFENRWPAMPDRRCEVVLYSPDHNATFASIEIGRA